MIAKEPHDDVITDVAENWKLVGRLNRTEHDLGRMQSCIKLL